MKKDKIRYNLINGIIFIIINIVLKFFIYGNKTIWLNYMPPLLEGTLSPARAIFKYSIHKIIPFILIDICIIVIYVFKMYNRRIYNKKTDLIFPLMVLILTFILLYFLTSNQYSICV